MELESISAEGVSAIKQVQVAQQATVQVAKRMNEQAKEVSGIVTEAIAKTPPPESGKGQRLNAVA